MNIDELENFTIDELSDLSIEELELDAKDLIEKLRNDNREMPASAVIKLQEICAPIPEVAPKIKKGMKFSDGCSLIGLLLNMAEKLPALIKTYKPIIKNVISTIIKHLT
ncbi:MAG: hypothetical protein IJK30_11440 [Ruminococcus sp.]|nr:hypothetical protein [Ruminococcus sp.]